MTEAEGDCRQKSPPPPPPPPTAARAIGEQGLVLIKRFEGCAKLRATGWSKPIPIPAPAAIRGRSAGALPAPVSRRAPCGRRSNATLGWPSDLARYAAEVERARGGAPCSQAQFDALVSFHYNTGAIAQATLTRKHRAGDYAGAKAEFGKWVNAGGKPMNELVRRRAAEAELNRPIGWA